MQKNLKNEAINKTMSSHRIRIKIETKKCKNGSRKDFQSAKNRQKLTKRANSVTLEYRVGTFLEI